MESNILSILNLDELNKIEPQSTKKSISALCIKMSVAVSDPHIWFPNILIIFILARHSVLNFLMYGRQDN